MTKRVIAERILTGEILSWDVPLLDGTSTRELSGPGGITGFVAPENEMLLGPDGLPIFREWATALYHEVDGDIRCAGIVTHFSEDEDGRLALEAPGFSTYPHGILHNKTYSPGLGCDALTAYRHFWDHVQTFPDSFIGVTVDGTLSGEVLDETVESNGKKVKRGYRVPWWEFRDCGTEMDQLLEVASADYIERHTWNAYHDNVLHHIELGVPRLGKKRSDLRFVEGENIIEPIPLTVAGDDFAQTIIGIGRGEGRKIIHTEVAHRDDRLRRTAAAIDKTASEAKIKRLANREYQRRNDTKGFETVVIRDHPNARISTIDPGDDILVEAELRWHGRIRLWNRVISIEQAISDDDVAILHLARSDQFRY